MLFIFIFSIGVGPLPWVIIGEIFPEECKSASASLSAVVNQLMAFITIKTVANIQVRSQIRRLLFNCRHIKMFEKMVITLTHLFIPFQAEISYSGTYFMYGSLCMLGFVYILFGVPETKGKTPEEILQYFKVGKRPTTVHLAKQEGETIV